MSIHQELLRAEVEKMDQEAKEITMLINDALPTIWSDLALKTQNFDRLSPADHPIDRLCEYRILEGKLCGELSRLNNIANSLRRRVEALSDRAQKLNKMAAWTPELVQELLGGGR